MKLILFKKKVEFLQIMEMIESKFSALDVRKYFKSRQLTSEENRFSKLNRKT